ncbi:DUF1707 domain-containing protein [Actinocrispum sp. NPDC049592]|uniref:DUF1707 SHOCT-like domain-containing protein n=1 Tax=Actinocrispum sp. NPDC049592 TaxID=3154835 RepID=UPI0034123985
MTEGITPDRIRVTDLDRQAVEARLRLAHANGSLTLTELDERLLGLWQSRTRGDLRLLTLDLPVLPPAPVPKPEPKPSVALKVLATIWLSLSAVNTTIWLIVCVTTATLVYPWFIWVLLPPGVVLGVIAAMLRPRR